MQTQCYSMSLMEQFKLIYNTNKLCQENFVNCRVSVYKSNELNAYVDYQNNLKFSSSILQKLSYQEAMSVAYHEVAHLVLNHPQFFHNNKRYLRQSKLYYETRRQSELEADKQASYLMCIDNFDNQLDITLQKIKPKSLWDKQTNSHPSVTERVKRIQKYKCTK